MLLHVAGDQTAIGVVSAANRGGNNVSDRLALVETGIGSGSLMRSRQSHDDASDDRQVTLQHFIAPFRIDQSGVAAVKPSPFHALAKGA